METLRGGRLNWVQDAWWVDDPKNIDIHANNVVAACGTNGRAMRDVLAGLHLVFNLHEPLRTLFDRNSSGYFRQRVVESPEDLPSIPGMLTFASPEGAREVLSTVIKKRFELDREFPVRFVVVADGAKVLELGIVGDHAVFDHWGIRVVRDDLVRALQGAAMEDYGQVAQPLDLVRWEDSPEGMRYHERAKGFWLQQLRNAQEIPMDGVWDVDQNALFGEYATESQVMLRNAKSAAGRLGVSESTVFMMAFASAMCELNGSESISFMAKTAGRISRTHMRSAGHMASHVPVILKCASGQIPAAAARAATSQQLLTHRFGRVDRRIIEELLRSDFPGIPSLAIAAGASPNTVGALFNYIGFSEDERVDASEGYSPEHLFRSFGRSKEFDQIHHSRDLAQGANLLLNIQPTADSVVLQLLYRDCEPISSAAARLLPAIRHHLHALTS